MIVINFVLKRNKNYGKISIENLNEKGVFSDKHIIVIRKSRYPDYLKDSDFWTHKYSDASCCEVPHWS